VDTVIVTLPVYCPLGGSITGARKGPEIHRVDHLLRSGRRPTALYANHSVGRRVRDVNSDGTER